MKKKVPVVSVAEPEEAARVADLPLEATVALADVASSIKEGLMAFVSATGLVVLRQLLEAEMTERIGPKHAKPPNREANWHGTTTGPVVLGGRTVSMERPRGRSRDGTEVNPTPGRCSPRRTCSPSWCASACWPGWPPAAMAR